MTLFLCLNSRRSETETRLFLCRIMHRLTAAAAEGKRSTWVNQAESASSESSTCGCTAQTTYRPIHRALRCIWTDRLRVSCRLSPRAVWYIRAHHLNMPHVCTSTQVHRNNCTLTRQVNDTHRSAVQVTSIFHTVDKTFQTLCFTYTCIPQTCALKLCFI